MTDVDRSRDPSSSPHNGLSPHHPKEGSSSNGPTPSTTNRVSFVGGVGIEDNAVGDDDDEQPGVFSRADGTRDSAYNGSISRRLSTVIRRSLRLGPKHSLGSGNRLSSARFPPQPSVALPDDKGQAFTDFTDLRRVPCETPYGTLDELQYYLRLNRINQVKKFVRNNDWPISHEIRSDIWRILCHNKDYDVHKRLYQQQLEDLTKSGGLSDYLREILYPLCAMFLHYMGPDDTFACVMRLLSQGNGFMLQSEVAVFASAHTTLALLKKHKKKVYLALKSKIGTNDDEKLAEIFNNWSAWVFKHLPYPYLVRVLDCFLVEGHKMLLRVVLSLTYLWYKEKGKTPLPSLLANSSIDEKLDAVREEIVQVIQDCPISISTLLDICTSIRNFKFSTVQRLQADFEARHRDKINLERSMKNQVSPSRTMYTQAFASTIIDSEIASELMNALPSRFQLETPSLLFRLSENGVSFTHFWTLIDHAEQSLLIIKTTKNEVFGAYCSASWSERRDFHERTRSRYFGTGESFVWYAEQSIGLPVIYQWAGSSSDHPEECPQMFMTANDKLLIVGSGGGDAISIRDELTCGLSYPCDTFNSSALVPGTAFDIAELEVFNVVSSVD